MSERAETASKNSKDDLSPRGLANYLDHGAAADFPNDPQAQQQAANNRLYIAVEENLAKNAPKDQRCSPYGALQGYDHENPYGYCGTDGVKTTDRFLEEVRSYEKPGVGLSLKLEKTEPGYSYSYDSVFGSQKSEK